MFRLFAGAAVVLTIATAAAVGPARRLDPMGASLPPPLMRPVTIYVPDAHPVMLGEVLRQIGRQTDTVLRLDPDVAADVRFSGRFTRTPLSLVLDALAKTGAFKWFRDSDGSVQIVPHDHLRLIVNAQPLAGAPCVQCGRPLDASWRFCPWCGHRVGAPRRGGPGPPGRR